MSIPQISLRTLLWILFAAAILTGWGWERWGYLAQIEQNPWKGLAFAPAPPSPSLAARQRHLMMDRLANLTDEEFRQEFSAERFNQFQGEWQVWTSEMVRRKMVDDLRAQLQAVKDAKRWPHLTAELITALRRAEGKPDPLKIEIQFVDWDREGEPDLQLVQGVVRNADVDREPITLPVGGDNRSGRRDRWRVELRDESGELVPDANYQSLMGGGLGSWEELKFGESANYRNVMDPRRFIMPPRSGRYQLQLLHCDVPIADEPDTAGFLVWKSAPIWVDVVNYDTQLFDSNFLRLGLITGLALLVVAVFHAFAPANTEEDSWFARWGNVVMGAAMILLAALWWLDARQFREYLASLKPHHEANWTIVAPKELAGESGGSKGPTKK